jgi:hypothetical protein
VVVAPAAVVVASAAVVVAPASVVVDPVWVHADTTKSKATNAVNCNLLICLLLLWRSYRHCGNIRPVKERILERSNDQNHDSYA